MVDTGGTQFIVLHQQTSNGGHGRHAVQCVYINATDKSQCQHGRSCPCTLQYYSHMHWYCRGGGGKHGMLFLLEVSMRQVAFSVMQDGMYSFGANDSIFLAWYKSYPFKSKTNVDFTDISQTLFSCIEYMIVVTHTRQSCFIGYMTGITQTRQFCFSCIEYMTGGIT